VPLSPSHHRRPGQILSSHKCAALIKSYLPAARDRDGVIKAAILATDPLLLEPEALVEEDPREGLEGGRATYTLQAILLGQSIRTALTPQLNKLLSRPAEAEGKLGRGQPAGHCINCIKMK
jgi:hypothetical protein